MELTFVMFKPDCLQRGLLGRILSRFDDKGLRLVAMKMLRITPAMSKQHYAEHVSKPFYPGLEEFITASPVVGCVFAGPEVVRLSIGLEDPEDLIADLDEALSAD